MKKVALIALALASLTVPATADTVVLCGPRLCAVFTVAAPPAEPYNFVAKITSVEPADSAETEAGWKLRCNARMIAGKGAELDRWEIGNPACR